jgi:glycosyltransferase involved in cell wall biosynthesis
MANRRLKILVICGQYPPTIGGGGTHTSYLCNELSNIKSPGAKVALITSHIQDTSKFEKKRNGLEIHRVDFKHSESLIYESAISKSLLICEKFEPDIIHGQHIDGAMIGLHLKASFNIPLIVTLHKTPLIRYDNSIPKRNSVYSNIKLLASLDYIDYFVAGSKIFEKEIRQIGIPNEKTKFIYHGVPYPYLQSLAFNDDKINTVKEQISYDENEFLIICPSRLDERKGLELLLKAVIKLKDEFSKQKIRIIITGEIREGNINDIQLRDRLVAIADSGGIKDSLVFKKFAFDHLPALFSIANTCILPSRKEGLGLVLLEALSVRCPVIAANSPGIDEVIENEVNGLLFEPEDPSDLFKQLLRLIENKQLVIGFKNNGIKKVKAIFNAKRMAEEHLLMYQEVHTKSLL